MKKNIYGFLQSWLFPGEAAWAAPFLRALRSWEHGPGPWALGPGPLALPSLALGPWTLGAQGTASLAGAVVDFVMVGPGLSILQDFVHVGALLCRRDDWSGQQLQTTSTQ